MINKIFDIWYKDNIIVKLFWKSFIAFIWIWISIKWNNTRFAYNIIITITINYTFNYDNIKVEKSNLIRNFNIDNNVYFIDV